MIKPNNNIHVKLFTRALIQSFVLALFLFMSALALANDTSLNTALNRLDFKATQSLVNNIRANKLDYLINQQKLTQAFKVSKEQNWPALHLEAAALYAELLFRQEEYDALNTHISNYINNKQLLKKSNIYSLFLEAQLKYLSQTGKLSQAKDLAQHLEKKIAQHSAKEKIIILRALAYYYTDTDSIRESLSTALEGLELAVKDDDIASQAYFLRKIADAYNFLNDKDDIDSKAVYYATKAVEAYEKTEDGLFTAKAYWSLANVLLEINKPQDALIYLNKALSYFKKVNMKKGLSFAQYSIANIQYKQGNYDTAITLAEENIELARTAGIHDMHLASMILLSDIYIKQNLLDKANQVSDAAVLNVDKFSRSIYKAQFLSKRYKLKRQLNYIDDAFEAIEKQLIYTKKHYEATSESNIKKLQVKFEVKEKEDKILQLEYEKNINEFKAKEEHQQKIIWRLGASIAFILVIITLFLFYRQARQRKKYHVISLTDYLTSSLNRRGIMEKAKAILNHQKATIAIIDLDHFKNINDEFGHDVGDLVLIKLTQAVRDTLSCGDQFGRYGGEEWLFVLNTLDEQEIYKTFESLSRNLSKYCNNIEALPNNVTVTFSAGVAIGNAKKNSLDTLIKHADKLLYKAKENGRNQVIID